MDHLVAADILIGDQAALPIVQGGNISNIAPNVSYLAARTVDKMWQGMLFYLFIEFCFSDEKLVILFP